MTMTTTLVCAVLLVAVLLSCVVLSMWVETMTLRWQRRRSARRVSQATTADPVAAPRPDGEVPEQDLVADENPVDEPGRDLVEVRAPAPAEELIVLPGRALADQAVGVLLAAYVASGGSAARRVAAWVTASATSSLSGSSYEPGTDLRGRTVAVRRLLELDEDGRCWITLRTDVDIARGLERAPVTCATLEGALVFWAATRSAMTALTADEVRRAVAAIDELASTWEGTTGGTQVLEPVALQLRTAAAHGAAARIQVPLVPAGDVLVTTGMPSTRGVRETV